MRRSSIVYMVTLALLGLFVVSCGGSGGDGSMVNPSLTVTFSDSGTDSAPDLVRLVGTPSGERVLVEVVLAGPTTSDDISSFAFDIEIGDTSVLAYGDVPAVAGPVLSTAGCGDLLVLAKQSGDRVPVGVAKPGCAGNGIPAGEQAIVTLSFRVLKAGSSTLALKGSPAQEPMAFDSGLNEIDSIQWDGISATIRAM